jgi:hypothetical protein
MYLSFVVNIHHCENVKSCKDYHAWTQLQGPSEFYSFINIITSLNHPQMIMLKRVKCGIHGMQRGSGEGKRTHFPPGTGNEKTEGQIRRKTRSSGQAKVIRRF